MQGPALQTEAPGLLAFFFVLWYTIPTRGMQKRPGTAEAACQAFFEQDLRKGSFSKNGKRPYFCTKERKSP